MSRFLLHVHFCQAMPPHAMHTMKYKITYKQEKSTFRHVRVAVITRLAFQNKMLNSEYSFGFIVLTIELVFKSRVLTSVKYRYDAVATDKEVYIWYLGVTHIKYRSVYT